ncbi:hypothetical protein F0310_04305 (plasmid) [Borrelia sp. A-FGy1]|uniref:hypothetical protein n=1 Tax=Borrelia sp. A-FGy1 TaxID=2608247 RepID=UPI0015F6EF63|nr:hypothetical protein [Borrelia sp. A-FGy1]QMU99640.1 hypothetical protein F0310_04305 [Borrelia sp. A-FGy1]
MKIYRMLLMLIIVMMSCDQQTSNKRGDKRKIGIFKTRKHERKKISIDQKKLDEKTYEQASIEDEKIEYSPYDILESKVKILRNDIESAKGIFVARGHTAPDFTDFNSIKDAIDSGKYSFSNILNLISRQTRTITAFPKIVDRIYASLGYNIDTLLKLEEIIPKVLNNNYASFDAFNLYDSFLRILSNLYDLNHKVLYDIFSDITLAKLKSANNLTDIEKASYLLDRFDKLKVSLVLNVKEQIEIATRKKDKKDIFEELKKAYGQAFRSGYLALDIEYFNILKLYSGIK